MSLYKSVLFGDTVRLKCSFKDFPDDNGVSSYVDPDSITLKIFDGGKKQIGDTINIGVESRQSLGVYCYDYVVPDKDSLVLPKSDCKLYPEFKGLINGNPIVCRCEIERRWVK